MFPGSAEWWLNALVSRASHFYAWGGKKTSGHCCTFFMNTAGMLAAPIKSLHAFRDNL